MTRGPSVGTRWQRAGLYLVTALGLAALLFSVYGFRERSTLRVGEPSPEAFVATQDVRIVDRIATERRRRAVREQVGPVLDIDEEVRRLVLGTITSSPLPQDTINYLVQRYEAADGVTDAEVADVIDEAVALAPPDRRSDVRLTLERRLLATKVPNDLATQRAREAAADAVEPVTTTLTEGTTIVDEGEALTAEDLRLLEQLDLYSAESDEDLQRLVVALGCLLLGALVGLPALALHQLRTHLTFQQAAFLVGLTVVTLAVQRVATLADSSFVAAQLLAILVTVLLSEAAGLLWAVWAALVVALLVPSDPLASMTAVLASSVLATRLVLVLRSRPAVLVAGAGSGLVAGATLIVVELVAGTFRLVPSIVDASIFVAGGALAGVLALGLLPLAESAFGFLTDFRLLELSNPTNPLLQKLLLDAPGSYQHSLIISNLVEQAVTNIGGNSLLARVGALYHDVGKLRRPHFFVENQFSGDNPHDALSPHLSYLIITSHVRDGVELLRQHGLPHELEAFVTEHHGTTVLSYFYKRALEDSATLDDLNFRYAGPKPRSKETAVLMLADAVESASRTLTDPSQGSIRAMIDRLIDQRLQDEQLSDSPLNFHDLEVIANTFERMLTAILHRRISYPSPEEIRGLRRGGDSRRSPAAVGS